MKTFKLEESINFLDVVMGKNNNKTKIEKGDILHGVIENVEKNKVGIKFEQVNRKYMLNKSSFDKDVKEGMSFDFEVKDINSSKIELSLIDNKQMLSNEELLKQTDDFKGLSSKDVFESYDFIESDEDKKDNKDTVEEDDPINDVSKNAYEESLRKILKYENFDIFKISLDDFVNMVIDSNRRVLSGLQDNSELQLSTVDENIKEDINETLDKVNSIMSMSENDVEKVSIQMLKNNDVLTLNNVFNSKFKVSGEFVKNKEFDVNNFEKDIKTILENIELEPSKENVELAKELIVNDIDVTKENVERLNEIKNQITNINPLSIVKNKIENSFYDINDVSLENEQKIEKVINDFNESSELILENREVNEKFAKENDIEKTNIKKIIEFTNKLIKIEAKVEPIINEKTEPLEKVRLMLTSKSAFAMYSKGINVELEQLKKVVTELEKINDKNIILENSKVMNDTFEKIEELNSRNLLMYKNIISDRHNVSIDYLLEKNKTCDNKLVITNKMSQQEIEKIYDNNMIESHYTLNGEHNIAKRNIEEVLKMLDIENTDVNKKCGIILSLSEKEISSENINLIKSMEEKVNYISNNLSPKVCLALIKDGLDITQESLDVVIEQINQKIETLKINDLNNNIVNSDSLYDSIAEMIVSNELSGELKDALLGIYKVVNKINKYSDAGLGILEYKNEDDNDIKLSLREVFDATKVLERRRYGDVINKTIDDSLGLLETTVENDLNAKRMIDIAFGKLKDKIAKQEQKQNVSLLKDNIEFANENKEIMKTMFDDNRETTFSDIQKVRDFEESKTLLKDNVLTNEILSNNETLKDDIDKMSNKIKNRSLTQTDENEHLDELRKIRNKNVKDILDEYELNANDENSLDVTNRILNSQIETLKRIDSINKILSLTNMTSRALSTSMVMNGEITNINIYFDSNVDLNKDTNEMIISLHSENIGDIKSDVRIDNVNKKLSINYITENEEVAKLISSSFNDIISSFNGGYKVQEININGKNINKNNDSKNLYIKSMNIKNKISKVL